MSWLLKQAEDILNRVDQQTNAALHQQTNAALHQQTNAPLHQQSSKIPSQQNQVEFIPNASTIIPFISAEQPVINRIPTSRIETRRIKKTDESDLINYLNSSTSINNNERKKPPHNKSRRTSSSSMLPDDPPITSQADKEFVSNIPSTQETIVNNREKELTGDIQILINELQTYKRQQIQYQQQIAESDALLRDLRSRESDSHEALSAKDSQIALLRVRLAESDELLRIKTSQYEQLQSECSRLLQNHTNLSDIQFQTFDSLQFRIIQLEKDLQQRLNEIECSKEEKYSIEKEFNYEKQQLIEQLKLTEKRFNDEHLQIYEQQQQTKHERNLIYQLEQDMNEYKIKAQRILQTKDKLISKLKDIVQHRSSTPTIADQNENETSGMIYDSTLLDISLVGNSSASSSSTPSTWASVQYEELKGENDLFKQELQSRELLIRTLRNELQASELLIQHSDEHLHEQTNQLNDQLKDEHSRLILVEQDYRKLKQDLTSAHDETTKQKQIHQGQLIEREREIERLRLQLTAKTINHVNDDELEKRLQTLTESLIYKQTIIETLQTDKSSLTMQLERLEKRLDDYETITTNNSAQKLSKNHQTTSIPIDDNEHLENLRYRMPLLRETPYDVDIAKKVKQAANELDKIGIRIAIFLRRYPAVRLAVLFYAILLHLWTFIVLFTYTPETHGNNNSMDLKDKL